MCRRAQVTVSLHDSFVQWDGFGTATAHNLLLVVGDPNRNPLIPPSGFSRLDELLLLIRPPASSFSIYGRRPTRGFGQRRLCRIVTDEPVVILDLEATDVPCLRNRGTLLAIPECSSATRWSVSQPVARQVAQESAGCCDMLSPPLDRQGKSPDLRQDGKGQRGAINIHSNRGEDC